MPEVCELLERFGRVLDDAAGVDLRSLGVEEVGVLVCGLQEVHNRLDALVCAVTVEAANAGVPATKGLFSVPSYVAGCTNVDAKAVAGDLRLGWWLLAHPVVDAAFCSGRISRRHVALLVKATSERTAAAMADAQQLFVDAAVTTSFRGFRECVAYWLVRADPDGRDPEAQLARRGVSVTTDEDGMVHGTFSFDPLAGSALKTALDVRVEKMRRADLAAGVTRTLSQLRADAVIALVVGGHVASGSKVALIHVVAGDEVLADGLCRLDDNDGLPRELPVDWADPRRRCELVDGTPLHPRWAVALLAIATLRRLVMNAQGEVLELGRGVRSYPLHLRQALLAQARGRCQHPACDAPAGWLEADHYLPWTRDGESNLDNGQILCRPHNQQKSNRIPVG